MNGHCGTCGDFGCYVHADCYYCATHDMYRPCAWCACDAEAFIAERARRRMEREYAATVRAEFAAVRAELDTAPVPSCPTGCGDEDCAVVTDGTFCLNYD